MDKPTGSDPFEPAATLTHPPSVSPSRKRNRESRALATKTKLDAPPPRRLRMRIDHSDRVWAGRCGCKSPYCMADEFEFSSDTGVSDESDESDGDGDAGDTTEGMDADSSHPSPSSGKRPPQDPSDLVPMMLHLMLMM